MSVVHVASLANAAFEQEGTQAEIADAYAKCRQKYELVHGTEDVFYLYKEVEEARKEWEVAEFLMRNRTVGPHVAPLQGFAVVTKRRCVCKYRYAGPTLGQVLAPFDEDDDWREWDGVTPELHEELAAYVAGHAEAVAQDLEKAYALLHVAGVLHGDVKPDNVCLHPETHRVCVIDFDKSAFVAEASEADRAKEGRHVRALAGTVRAFGR